MVENKEQRKRACRYFIECEKIAKGDMSKISIKPIFEGSAGNSNIVTTLFTNLPALKIGNVVIGPLSSIAE